MRLDLTKHRILIVCAYDNRHFRTALEARSTTLCILSTKSRRIKDMFGHPEDWRRVVTRYDRAAQIFFSTVTLAAIITFWL